VNDALPNPEDVDLASSDSRRRLGTTEGTLVFRYTLQQPLGESPPQPVEILDIDAGGVSVRLELTPRLTLRHSRSGEGRGTRSAEVDIRPFRGANVFQIYLTWSPMEVGITIGSNQPNTDLLSATSTNSG
jgi:hypothetical protein